MLAQQRQAAQQRLRVPPARLTIQTTRPSAQAAAQRQQQASACGGQRRARLLVAPPRVIQRGRGTLAQLLQAGGGGLHSVAERCELVLFVQLQSVETLRAA
jgi:hypothetical protein